MRESLPVSVRINGKIYELDYERELSCSEESINEDLKSQAPLFAWYAVMQELADEAAAEMKLALEITQARLGEKHRAALVAAGVKPTEAMVDAKVKLDEEYQSAVILRNDCDKNAGILRAIKEAFNHRKDCLISLASNMRCQSDPEIFIKKQEFREKK